VLEFVTADPRAVVPFVAVYRHAGGRVAWVGTIKPGMGGAPEFFPRTPMGWPGPFRPSAAESERIKKFLLTLVLAVVQ